MKVKKNVNLFIKFLSVNMIWVNISSLYEIQPETTPNQIHKPMSKKKKKKDACKIGFQRVTESMVTVGSIQDKLYSSP